MALKAVEKTDQIERIADSDMDTHVEMAGMLVALQQRQAQLGELQREIVRLDGIVSWYSGKLRAKYNLGPSESVDENGIITRAAKPPVSIEQ